MSRVYPSGAAWATRAVPMTPLAPARFSITIGWPRIVPSRSPRIRASWSVMPPAPVGTTRWIVRSGQAAMAGAAWIANVEAARRPKARKRRRMYVSVGCGCPNSRNPGHQKGEQRFASDRAFFIGSPIGSGRQRCAIREDRGLAAGVDEHHVLVAGPAPAADERDQAGEALAGI